MREKVGNGNSRRRLRVGWEKRSDSERERPGGAD